VTSVSYSLALCFLTSLISSEFVTYLYKQDDRTKFFLHCATMTISSRNFKACFTQTQ